MLTVDYPAADGRVVTERHARICREQGHASHVVDGENTGRCARCGDRYLIDATETEPAVMVLVHVDAELGRLRRADSHLHHILTHAVELSDRPKTPSDRRGHAISRVLYTWLRREDEDPEAVAQDIETLAALGRSEKWKAAVRTWAHIARTDPVMFHQFATYTNFAA